ncbi:ER membrane protein complex subunit 6-like [Daphnia carinata]|uniref:ER membrane protein complex subunit 6-like n=1 Tax=Daphnia carinata TaxID=120202 RepID=UPI0025797032|nr:ER membrane protein complex subunit 6-like [Daphnia carinata]
MASKSKTRPVEKNNGEVLAFSEGAIRNNAMVVEYCRTSMAALGGAAAGILGLTSLYGFVFYIFCAVAIWLLLLLKAGPHWQKYFTSRSSLLSSGLSGGLITYVLFWTFIYGMVHVY